MLPRLQRAPHLKVTQASTMSATISRTVYQTCVLTVIHVYASQREIDNCRVFLLDEIVLSESLDVQDQERWQASNLESAQNTTSFLRRSTVVLGKHLCDWNLWNNSLLVLVLEQRRRRQVDCEEQEWRSSRFDVCGAENAFTCKPASSVTERTYLGQDQIAAWCQIDRSSRLADRRHELLPEMPNR